MKCLLFILLLLTTSAQAAVPDELSLTNPMVADLSQNAIEIRANFNGAQLLVFGAQNLPGDLVIAVRGPEARVTLRRKERIAGMWMHVEQHKYDHVPLFYAMAMTKPLDQIASPAALQSLGLGEAQVTLVSNGKPNALFDQALHDSFERKRWWQPSFSTITYFGESLFKARLDLPDTLPGGTYTAEVYLFDRGTLEAVQTIPLSVSKTGIEAELVTAANTRGLSYGLVAVAIALFGGWFAHRLFHRG